MLTHYDVLNVSRNAPAEVIKAAYKVLAQKYHPDRWSGVVTPETDMALINKAYAVLIDPTLRAEYDEFLALEEKYTTHSQKRNEQVNCEKICPVCGVVLMVPALSATIPGQKFRCKNCSTVFLSDGKIVSRANNPESKQEPTASVNPKIIQTSKSRFGWDLWLSCFVGYVIVKFFGAAGGISAVLIYFSLKPRLGRLGAFATAGIASISIVLILTQYINNEQQSQIQTVAAAPELSNTFDASTATLSPPAAYKPSTTPETPSQQALPSNSEAQAQLYRAILSAHPEAAALMGDADLSSDFNVWLNSLPKKTASQYNGYLRNGTTREIVGMFSKYKVARNGQQPNVSQKVNRSPAENSRFTAEQQVDIDAVVRRAVQDYPYLDTPAGYDDVQKIMKRRDELIREGVYPSIALTRAVQAFAPAHGP